MTRTPWMIPALALALTACDSGGGGTSVSFKGEDGNVVGAIDGKSGEMKIDVPGFKGAISLPKIKLDAENFDVNGVHLYPGSTIESMNIADAGKAGKDGVRVSFTSPATPEAVRAWFAERFGKAGFDVRTEGSSLVGKTDEQQDFRMDLTPKGSGEAKGTISIGG